MDDNFDKAIQEIEDIIGSISKTTNRRKKINMFDDSDDDEDVFVDAFEDSEGRELVPYTPSKKKRNYSYYEHKYDDDDYSNGSRRVSDYSNGSRRVSDYPIFERRSYPKKKRSPIRHELQFIESEHTAYKPEHVKAKSIKQFPVNDSDMESEIVSRGKELIEFVGNDDDNESVAFEDVSDDDDNESVAFEDVSDDEDDIDFENETNEFVGRKGKKKPCKAGKVRDSKTKRCRKKKSPGRRKSSCKKGYSRSRTTGKCRKTSCKKGKVRDKVTKKCRKSKRKSSTKSSKKRKSSSKKKRKSSSKSSKKKRKSSKKKN